MPILRKYLRFIYFFVIFAIVLALLIQLIPYGKDHTNPPILSEPNWDSPQTLALARRACFDCHSNETTWPWYSKIAPVSWLVYRDVVEGRRRLNFSDWRSSSSFDTREILEVINEGEMPPFQYLPTHPDARLSQTEKQQLIDGLTKTFGR